MRVHEFTKHLLALKEGNIIVVFTIIIMIIIVRTLFYKNIESINESLHLSVS